MNPKLILVLAMGASLLAALTSGFFYGRSYERTIWENKTMKAQIKDTEKNIDVNNENRRILAAPLDDAAFTNRLLGGTQ